MFLDSKNVPSIKTFESNFQRLKLPDLLINIWTYNYESHLNCNICIQYEKWCVEVAKSKWQSEFLDFEYVISNIRQKNKWFFNFDKVSSADKNIIYRKIWKMHL